MCNIIRINYSVIMTVILAFLLLAASVPRTLANYDSDSKTRAETSPKGSSITCQAAGLACPGEGVYKCCDGLVCTPNTLGGVGLCLPPLVPEKEGGDQSPPYNKCREITKACIGYGDYDCCGDLSCVPTTTFPVDPVGAGVCLPMGRKRGESGKDKCQKQQLQLCQPWGQYQCCVGYACADPRTLPYPVALPIDPTKLPPGVGVCIPAKM